MEQTQEKSTSIAMEPPPYSAQTQVIQNQPAPAPDATVPVTAVPVATVYTRGNVVVQMPAEPTLTYCKSCHTEITTQIQRKNTTRTHMFAMILCFLGGIFCVWIPYVMKSCKNTDHYCPNCEAYIGSYKV